MFIQGHKPNGKKLSDAFDNLKNALDRFNEALSDPDLAHKEIVQDGTIQRFEFTFELFWKTVKKVLKTEGVETTGPRDVLQNAFQMGFIDNEKIWVEMLGERNIMFHVYDGAQALRIVKLLPDFYKVMMDNFEKLKSKTSI